MSNLCFEGKEKLKGKLGVFLGKLFHLRFQNTSKNPFDASLILDNPDIKIVEARYRGEPIFFAIGISNQRRKKIAAEGTVKGARGEYEAGKDIEWHLIYNPESMPHGFVPIERFKTLMIATTAAVSESNSVYETTPQYRPLKNVGYRKTVEYIHRQSSQKELAFKRIRNFLKEVSKKRGSHRSE